MSNDNQPDTPLMTRIYELHDIRKETGATLEQCAAQLVSEGYGLTMQSARSVMSTNPMALEARYQDTFNHAEVILAKCLAERAAQEWRDQGPAALGL